MKNSKKGFIVPLLLVVIAILAVGGGYYFYSNKKVSIVPVQQDNNISTSTVVVSTTASSPIDISGWKTYVFKDTQVSYPNDLKLRVISGGPTAGKGFGFVFPSSYFSNSGIEQATTNFIIGVSQVLPVGKKVILNNILWNRIDTQGQGGETGGYSRQIIYQTDNMSFGLNLISSKNDLSGQSAENIISIFEKMVATYK